MHKRGRSFEYHPGRHNMNLPCNEEGPAIVAQKVLPDLLSRDKWFDTSADAQLARFERRRFVGCTGAPLTRLACVPQALPGILVCVPHKKVGKVATEIIPRMLHQALLLMAALHVGFGDTWASAIGCKRSMLRYILREYDTRTPTPSLLWRMAGLCLRYRNRAATASEPDLLSGFGCGRCYLQRKYSKKPEGGGRGTTVTREGAIHVTNVNLVCPETG